MQFLAQYALAGYRECFIALFTAPGAALSLDFLLFGQRTMQHWTRFLNTFQAPIFALALEAGIFTRRHLAPLQHCLTVVFAACGNEENDTGNENARDCGWANCLLT